MNLQTNYRRILEVNSNQDKLALQLKTTQHRLNEASSMSSYIKDDGQKFQHYQQLIEGFKQDDRMKQIDRKLLDYLKSEYQRGFWKAISPVCTEDVVRRIEDE